MKTIDDEFEMAKAYRMGSYAKNVIYHSRYGHVCPTCGGPKKSDFQTCFGCGREADEADNSNGTIRLADTVRISHYAIKYDQMYRVMDGYKKTDDPSSHGYQTTLKYILGDALFIHYRCIREATGKHPTAWTTIPSTKTSTARYGRPSVLESLVAPILAPFRLKHVPIRSLDVKHRYRVVPEAFELCSPQRPEDLEHVLVIDDSWTSGGTSQSVAAMLKRHGAKQVTIYCAARIIDLGYAAGISPSVAEGYRNLPYEIKCPWMLDQCELYQDARC